MIFVFKKLALFKSFFFFSSRRRHTRYWREWSSDVCSSDLDVRGFGLMVGCELVQGGGSLEAAPELRDRVEVECFNRGLIVLGCGYNTIRWSPPLVLTRENVDVALEIFDEAITAACG